MPFTTELPVFSACRPPVGIPLRLLFPKVAHGISFVSDRASFTKLKCNFRRARRISMSLERDLSSSEGYKTGDAISSILESSDYVDVIVIGSRKDSIINFCLESPSHVVPLRFWSIIVKSSSDVQLEPRVRDKDNALKIVESSHLRESHPKAVILVVNAGYSSEHTVAIEIINALRSSSLFAVAIILRPFSFEGQKRLDEVRSLVGKLQKHSNFCIDIDIESILKNEMVTLDEALKAASSTVSLTINAISALVNEMHVKYVDGVQNNVMELNGSEVKRILENYREAKAGFGTGHNLKTSVLRAIYDCPLVFDGVKDFNAVIICISASFDLAENNGVQTIIDTLYEAAQCTGEIMIYAIHDSKLEKNVLVTAFFIVGCPEQESFQKTSIFSSLAKHLPFVFNIFKGESTQSDRNKEHVEVRRVFPSSMMNLLESDQVDGGPDTEVAVGGIAGSPEKHTEFHSNYGDVYAPSEFSLDETKVLQRGSDSSHLQDKNTETEDSAFQRERISSWNTDFDVQSSRNGGPEKETCIGDTPVLDSPSTTTLPVGVRPLDGSKERVDVSVKNWEKLTNEDCQAEAFSDPTKLLKSFNETASVRFTEKHSDAPKKQGNLSVRAASMLEAERDMPKRWSPTLEMQYKGGVYRGRCQGGLPEGKGRLILGDGSIYDGMWRYGKRSGLGTFYFNNGDVFQGTWRDDAIHGKGWFYFHNGDRWFSNFWKGKANGEGRIYSKSGEVFFGQFKDGWRHGCFLCIHADGTRCVETWEEGVLVSRRQVDDATED